MDGFQQNRIADGLGDLHPGLHAGDDAVTTGNDRNARLGGGVDGVGLVAHQLHAGEPGTDEVDPAIAAHQGEVRIFGQKADTGMERIDLLLFGDPHDRFCVEIGLVRGVAADADQGVPVGELAGDC